MIRRALDRFPSEYLVQVWRPEPCRYTLMFFRGDHQLIVTLRTDGGPLDRYEYEIQAWGQKMIKVIEASIAESPHLVQDNPKPVTVEDALRVRLDDLRRTMSQVQVDERLAKGKVKGFETFADRPRLPKSPKLPVKPMIHISKGEIQ